jgi:hypothetical protein
MLDGSDFKALPVQLLLLHAAWMLSTNNKTNRMLGSKKMATILGFQQWSLFHSTTFYYRA